MNKRTCLTFIPERASLLLVFLLLYSLSSIANEKNEYGKFEKIYQNLQFETVDKKNIKLKNLSSSFVIINFWASWCLPCLEEIPSLIKLSKKMTKNELTVIMINTDVENQLKNIAKTKEKLNIPDSFLIVPDNKFQIADEFKFSAIPVSIIYKDGKVIYFKNGPVDFLSAIAWPSD